MLAKHALSQLSYGPEDRERNLRKPFEHSSHGLLAFNRSAGSIACAARKRLEEWWAWEDLNFRPHAYQARALTN